MNLLHVRKQDRDLKHFILLFWSKFIFKKSNQKPLNHFLRVFVEMSI